MKEISFEDIYTLGDIVMGNSCYRHFHNSIMRTRYDSNFIEFKQDPSLSQFKEVEEYLRDFHIKKGQDHLKFVFPANTKLTGELMSYLEERAFEIGWIELYAIKPVEFPALDQDTAIDVQKVTEETLELLVNLKYNADLEFGEAFARHKMDLTRQQFTDPSVQQVLAFYQGIPAGYVDLIVSQKTIEIDDLTVKESLQRKGIGSRLQKFAMDTFSDKTVILLADGQDTPREMYKKQNYHYLGFKYEALKVN